MLCQSLFRKALPKKPVANVDALITTRNVQHMGLHAATVVRRTTVLSNVEALGGGSVHLVTHHPWKGYIRDIKDSAADSLTKAGDNEEEATSSRDSLPNRRGCHTPMSRPPKATVYNSHFPPLRHS